ncbi:MAG: acetyl-CoA hydrolase, partial [Gammaproteobacteria bacterium]|nr:acetyl-CoA hydrolase [Gammaproteobacteria bacterium]
MQVHAQVDSLVDAVLDRLGRRIVLGLPLGLGKANHIANALYDRAAQDPSIHLRILTALSLDPPQPSGNLEQRFLSPINARLFGGYPRLRYVQALRAGMLPANVEVSEFFLTAGQWLGVAPMQQQFICANYTHATRYLLDQGVNLVAQLVARKPSGELSLSCNPELTLELLGPMRERSRAGIPCMLVGQVNDALPFMLGDPVLAPERMDHLLDDDSTRFPLFTPPRRPVDPSAHAIGLRIAALVPDGGTLQIGIGGIADAVCHGLILRHTHNDAFRLLHEQLSPGPSAAPPRPQGDDAHPITDAQRRTGDAPELGAFEQGLYGLSEMFVDGFLHLYRHGVLKRSAGDGALLHAGFFLASNGLHETLREMPDHERARFQMKPISFVNELYDSDTASEQTKRHDRQGARFINSAMMVTALGGVVSDTLEDAQVVSGVGGQYNFVAQAFALRDARSIIALNATRQHEGRCVSNIRWAHSSETIPRHLRDIVVTEYGVA